MTDGSGLRIARMKGSHLREVFSLVEAENWGWEYAEIRQMHLLDPESSVVALDGGTMVGLVTCVDFGSLAFIVHVIVRKGWRGKGVGVRMMEETLRDLDSRGVSAVELHANPEAVEFYDQFSFAEVEEISFLAKGPPLGPSGATPAGDSYALPSPLDTRVVARGLSAATGYSAEDIGAALSKMPADRVLGRVSCGRMTDLLLSRTGADLNGAGPWVMERASRGDARAMILEMLAKAPPKRTDMLVPSSNGRAREALESCGFSVMKEGIVRTVRSSAPTRPFPDSLLAVGHLGLI